MALKNTRLGLLRGARPITGTKGSPKSLKPQQSRQIIRRFHVLQKNKSAIIARLNTLIVDNDINTTNYKEVISDLPSFNDHYNASYLKYSQDLKKSDKDVYRVDELENDQLIDKLARIDAEVVLRGGIETYQSASTQGQDSNRGGDSSKRLIEWLKDDKYAGKLQNTNALEIGCLSAKNMISTSKIFSNVVRIDLNSQSPLILQQDFMKRPLPKNDSDKFNVISCSLVINFVPSPKERGDMLIRMTKFLKRPTSQHPSCLFFVLPLPCVTNSRYFDKHLLEEIMKSLGFRETFYHEAKKVAYWFYDWDGTVNIKSFPKKEIHSGANRNNFCIAIK
jgi:25S rRNA (adenine2142-N1)-methyltransferase